MQGYRIIDNRAWMSHVRIGQPARLIVFQSPDLERTGHVVVEKEKPTDAEIKAAIEKELAGGWQNTTGT